MDPNLLARIAAAASRPRTSAPPPGISLAMGDIAIGLRGLGAFPDLAAPQSAALDLLATRVDGSATELFGTISVCLARPGRKDAITSAELVVAHLLQIRGYRSKPIRPGEGLRHDRAMLRSHSRHAEIRIIEETRADLAGIGWTTGSIPPAPVRNKLEREYRAAISP